MKQPTVESDFLSAIKRVKVFASQDEDRPVLQCILVEKMDNGVKLTACDGFTLGTIEVSGVMCHWPEGITKALVLPHILEAMTGWREYRHLAFEGDQGEGYAETCNGVACVVGYYPDYTTIIPKWEYMTTTVEVDAEMFNLAAKGLSALDKQWGGGQVQLIVTDNGLRLEARADGCYLRAEVKGQATGVMEPIYADVKFLARLAAKKGMVKIGLQSPVLPLLNESAGLTTVVMPMSRNSNWDD